MSEYPHLPMDSAAAGEKSCIPQINDENQQLAPGTIHYQCFASSLVMKPRGVKKGTAVAQQ